MNSRLSLTAVGHATSLFIAISYTLCVVFDLLLPQFSMYQTWASLLPGFTGLNWLSFFIGLIEAYAYGWFFALVWVPLYNVFAMQSEQHAK